METFQTLAQEWRALPRDEGVLIESEAKKKFLRSLDAPNEGRLFQAANAFTHGGPAPDDYAEIAEMLSGLDVHRRNIAEVWIVSARVMRELAGKGGDPAEQLRAQLGVACCAGQLRDIADDLIGDVQKWLEAQKSQVFSVNLRSSLREVSLPVLLVAKDPRKSEEEAIIAILTLELISEGTRHLYPIPALSAIDRDAEFRQGEENAKLYALQQELWGERYDVRWHLKMLDGHPLPTHLVGNSASGAFLLGLIKLLEGPKDRSLAKLLEKLDLSHVAISVATGPDGRLGPVGAARAKLFTAKFNRTQPRIRTIVFAKEQESLPFNLIEHKLNRDIRWEPGEDFLVLLTATIDDALRLLMLQAQDRWPTIDCTVLEPPSDAVVRQQLIDKVREFIATQRSGYLVIIGDTGTGKSTWFRQMIAAEHERRREPIIYHVIDYRPSQTGLPSQIAGCLYDRLRCKYGFPEPPEWAGRTIEDRLEMLLKRLSETEFRKRTEPEVIYIDAADQSEANALKPLLPGALRNLPPGVICVITSRTNLAWLNTCQDVTRLEMRYYVDDPKDIGAYLRLQNLTLSPPLLEEFIEQIVRHEPPPVFFTVMDCLRRLRSPDVSEEEKDKVRTKPALWCVAAEKLIEIEAGHVIRQAAEAGISEAMVWRTLGLLAFALEEMSENRLQALGLWQEGVTDVILKLAASFLVPRETLRMPHVPYRFNHAGYHRAVVSRLSDADKIACHCSLAGDWRQWKEMKEFVRLYALRHLPSHLCQAQRWGELCAVLLDFDFQQDRIGATSPAGVDPAATISDVVRDLHDALDGDVALPADDRLRPQIDALDRCLNANAHALREFPRLLVPLVYNSLVSKKNDSKENDSKPLVEIVRAAASKYLAPWLRRTNPAASVSDDRLLCKFTGHRGPVTAVVFCGERHRKTLVTASSDCSVRVYDVGTGHLERECNEHTREVTSLAYAPRRGLLASGSLDDTVVLRDGESGRSIGAIQVQGNGVQAIALSPDGRLLATGSADNKVRLWDVRTRSLLQVFTGHTDQVLAVAFSPNGKVLASAGYDESIIVWNVESGTLRWRQAGLGSWIESVAFSPNGGTLVSGGGAFHGELRLWDPENGALQRMLPGHRGGVRCIGYSSNGALLASGSWDRTLIVRDAATGAVVGAPMGHGHHIQAVAFSPDNKWVASASADRTVKLWEINQPAAPSKSLLNPTAHEDLVYATTFSPNGNVLASGGQDKAVILRHPHTGVHLGTVGGHNRSVNSIAFSPTEPNLMAVGSSEQITLWNSHSGRMLVQSPGHLSYVLALAFSPDGSRLASGSQDRSIMFWNARTGAWQWTLTGHTEKVTALAFSSDGTIIASGSKDSTIILWEVATGTRLRTLTGHTSKVNALAFSPDNRTLVTVSRDETLQFWDVATGKNQRTLTVQGGDLLSVAFSPNGAMIASGSVDGTVRLWDAGTGALLVWSPCADRVLGLWFNGASTELRVADAGDAMLMPNVYVFDIVNVGQK